jgi:hypothetical protein
MAADRRINRRAAFLNVPYDRDFTDLFLAYIAGIVGHGLTPRATLEVPGGARRLDRIIDLIQECRYSFHDLSRVELDTATPATPRFNMPFELGLAVACDRLTPNQHTWFVMESEPRRLLKSLSDLAGTDAYVHDGSPEGIFREIGNALVRTARQPTVQDLRIVHGDLRAIVPEIIDRTAAKSLFEARAFQQLVVEASVLADKMVR